MDRTKSWPTFFLFQQTTTYDTIWKKRSVATKMKLQHRVDKLVQCFLRLHLTPFVICCCKSACYLDKKCSPLLKIASVFLTDINHWKHEQIFKYGKCVISTCSSLEQNTWPKYSIRYGNIISFWKLNVHSTGSVAIAGQTHFSSYL